MSDDPTEPAPEDLPLVSVVIPCYKHEGYIGRAIQSVVDQDYPQIEIIIVDDRSPDRSVQAIDVALAEAMNHPHIVRCELVVNERNLGAHDSFDRGIGIARGQVVSLMNSDDFYMPGRLSRLVPEALKDEYGLAFSRVRYVDDDERDVVWDNETAYTFHALQDGIALHPTVGFALLIDNVTISTGNFVMQKRLYETVGPFMHYKHCHDWDFVLKTLVLTEPVFVDEPLYAYRFHGSNSFSSLYYEGIRESIALLGHFRATVRHKPPRNKLCPCKHYWPGVYDAYSQSLHSDVGL